jgi:hypothetical protein
MNVRTKGLAVLVGAAAVAVTAMSVSATAAPAPNGTATNPFSPSYQHSYRHGAIPTLQTKANMAKWDSKHATVTPNTTGTRTLSYGGGVDGIGVTTGHSKVYLVFYGTQWGTQTISSGISSFSGDSKAGAPAAQKFFQGIGTGSETWSNVLQQYCEGVATGTTNCGSSGTHIPAQTGGVLSGVWYDNAAASPSAASAAQLGNEAVKAAAHFGNTSASLNRNAYYVILSPHGTNPDNYQGQYCAWHDWNGDVGVSSPYGDLAFSNQPYNMDSGAGCGVGFINSPGTLDGWTMTLGHEWAEMMSDQNPAGGWTNHTSSSYSGQENADECAWLSSGTGHAANVTFGTGTFALQGSWSNATNACRLT